MAVSAKDADSGANGQVAYYLVQSSYDYVFQVDSATGTSSSISQDKQFLVLCRRVFVVQESDGCHRRGAVRHTDRLIVGRGAVRHERQPHCQGGG